MIQVIKGDITQLKVAAIVNAANSDLRPGGGVCGAIHQAAGPELAEACRLIGGCPTGLSVITSGYKLPARYVIHAVGPIWHGGKQREDELLRECYQSAIRLAFKYDCKSIAFPCISTGIYGYPKPDACLIAISAIEEMELDTKMDVTFCCFDDENYQMYLTEWEGAPL